MEARKQTAAYRKANAARERKRYARDPAVRAKIKKQAKEWCKANPEKRRVIQARYDASRGKSGRGTKSEYA